MIKERLMNILENLPDGTDVEFFYDFYNGGDHEQSFEEPVLMFDGSSAVVTCEHYVWHLSDKARNDKRRAYSEVWR